MKKLLIVVDYQNDFVDGNLGFPKARELEEAIVSKIQEHKEEGQDIVFTFDTHEMDYLETQEGKNLPVIHCVYGTKGWDIHGKVAEFLSDAAKTFKKGTFGSIELVHFLENKEYEEVELVGVVSNICVLSNAVLVKTVLPETRIIVDAKCTASNDDILHEKALDILENLHVQVINRK